MTTEEYNKCVDQWADGVYRFILKNLRNEDDARDVVQDAFEKLWIKVDEVEGAKAKSYLFTTAYHTMIDKIRRDKKMVLMEEEHHNIHFHEKQYTGLKEALDLGLSKLPEVQKSVLMLRDYEGYSYQEIGEIMNLTESQVKVYIYRARVTLKSFIGNPEVVA